MVEGLRVVQRAGADAFSVAIERAGKGFEYEVRSRPDGVSMQEVSEVLFSIALDIQAKESARARN